MQLLLAPPFLEIRDALVSWDHGKALPEVQETQVQF